MTAVSFGHIYDSLGTSAAAHKLRPDSELVQIARDYRFSYGQGRVLSILGHGGVDHGSVVLVLPASHSLENIGTDYLNNIHPEISTSLPLRAKKACSSSDS